jgi:hypothetical protein
MTPEEEADLARAIDVWAKWRHIAGKYYGKLYDPVIGTNGLVWPDVYKEGYKAGLAKRWPSRGYVLSWTFWAVMWSLNVWNIGTIVYQLWLAPDLPAKEAVSDFTLPAPM